MKILHLFQSYLPPTQVWLYQLLKHIPQAEIHIAARHYLKYNFYDPSFSFADHFLDGVQRLNNSLDKSKPSHLLKKVIIKILPFALGSLEKQIIQYAQQNEIEIIHTHFAPYAWAYRRIALKLKVPFVISFYGFDYEMRPFSHPAYVRYYSWLFRYADAIICEGPHGAQTLAKMGCPQKKIRIVNLGVEIKHKTYQKRKKGKNQLRLVQIASFVEKKGQWYAVFAFAEALRTCPNMSLTLVGNAPDAALKKQVELLIDEKDLNDHIQIVDWIDYDNIDLFLKNYDVFIHPSCYSASRDCEGGAPIVLLDAQINGLPVISTNHCDIPNEVLHEQTGLLSIEKDYLSIAQSIIRFYHMDEKEYERFSLAAYQHVIDQFNVDNSGRALSQIYADLLRKS